MSAPASVTAAASALGPQLSFSGEPSALLLRFSNEASFKELVSNGQRFSLVYTHRAFGRLALEGAVITAADASAYRVHADRLVFGAESWFDVAFSLRPEGQRVELSVETHPPDLEPIELTYSPARGGASWTLRLPHQPARRALQHYRAPWVPDSDATRLLTTLSLAVPEGPELPLSGRVELVLDDWEKPAWSDAPALLGRSLALGAAIAPSADGTRWELQNVVVSGVLFTLSGTGRVEWGTPPSLTLEASGERTCRQLQANLAPSAALDEVSRFLADSPAGSSNTAPRVRLDLHIRTAAGADRVNWSFSGGCGLPALN